MLIDLNDETIRIWIFLFQSKVMIKKQPKIDEISTMSKIIKVYMYFKTWIKVVLKFHVSIYYTVRDISRQKELWSRQFGSGLVNFRNGFRTYSYICDVSTTILKDFMRC